MNLNNTLICINCDELFEPDFQLKVNPDEWRAIPGTACPSCGSQQHMRLSRWIHALTSTNEGQAVEASTALGSRRLQPAKGC